MEDSTTTVAPADAGADQAQPAQAVDTTAATQPAEPTPNEAKTEPSTDENLDWLTKKGIDPSSPEALSKLAEMARNAEKKMHESTAEASELKKSLSAPDATPTAPDDVTGLRTEVESLKRTIEVNSFMSDPEHKAMEPKMAEMVSGDPTLKALVNQGYVSIESLYYMAKGSDATREAQLKADGGKEALQQVASKQQARAIPGNATTSAMAGSVTKANFNEWYAGLSASERAKPETQSIVAGLL